MKCYKCGNELNYLNDKTLICPYCLSLYNATKDFADNQQNLQSSSNDSEKFRPMCNVVETNKNEINKSTHSLDSYNYDNILFSKTPSTDNKKSDDKIFNDNIIQDTFNNDNNNKNKKQKKVKKEKINLSNSGNTILSKNAKNITKDKLPLIIFFLNFISLISIFCLPFLYVTKEYYKNSELVSVYLYRNLNINLMKELFSNYYFICYVAIILSIVCSILILICFFLFFNSNKNILQVNNFILILSLIIFVCFLICYFNVPTKLGSPFYLKFISFSIILPITSILQIIILNNHFNKPSFTT